MSNLRFPGVTGSSTITYHFWIMGDLHNLRVIYRQNFHGSAQNFHTGPTRTSGRYYAPENWETPGKVWDIRRRIVVTCRWQKSVLLLICSSNGLLWRVESRDHVIGHVTGDSRFDPRSDSRQHQLCRKKKSECGVDMGRSCKFFFGIIMLLVGIFFSFLDIFASGLSLCLLPVSTY